MKGKHSTNQHISWWEATTAKNQHMFWKYFSTLNNMKKNIHLTLAIQNRPINSDQVWQAEKQTQKTFFEVVSVVFGGVQHPFKTYIFIADTHARDKSQLSPKARTRKELHAVAILRGSLGGPWPPRFLLGPPFGPRSFFLNFPFQFVWLTYAGLPNAFCKNTGHFVNSARSKLCRNSEAAQGKQRQFVLLSHN